MDELDFSGKTVLVVGGASGIGNGIAHAFRQRGAEVHVWGTRPAAADYRADEGSDLDNLRYAQVDVSDFTAVDSLTLPHFYKLIMTVEGMSGSLLTEWNLQAEKVSQNQQVDPGTFAVK